VIIPQRVVDKSQLVRAKIWDLANHGLLQKRHKACAAKLANNPTRLCLPLIAWDAKLDMLLVELTVVRLLISYNPS